VEQLKISCSTGEKVDRTGAQEIIELIPITESQTFSIAFKTLLPTSPAISPSVEWIHFIPRHRNCRLRYLSLPSLSWMIGMTAFWILARRHSRWTIARRSHASPDSRCRLRTDTNRPRKIRRQLLSTQLFEAHSSIPCQLRRQARTPAALFERAAEIKPDDYQSVCLLFRFTGRLAVTYSKMLHAESETRRA